MAGLSPKLPVRRDTTYGYALTRTYTEMVLQNFKNLVLTNPGERMMDPDFGVGLKRYLFETESQNLYGRIASDIEKQARRYMPFIRIDNVVFYGPDGAWSTINGFFPREDPYTAEQHKVQIKIMLTIKPLSRSVTLNMDL